MLLIRRHQRAAQYLGTVLRYSMLAIGAAVCVYYGITRFKLWDTDPLTVLLTVRLFFRTFVVAITTVHLVASAKSISPDPSLLATQRLFVFMGALVAIDALGRLLGGVGMIAGVGLLARMRDMQPSLRNLAESTDVLLALTLMLVLYRTHRSALGIGLTRAKLVQWSGMATLAASALLLLEISSHADTRSLLRLPPAGAVLLLAAIYSSLVGLYVGPVLAFTKASGSLSLARSSGAIALVTVWLCAILYAFTDYRVARSDQTVPGSLAGVLLGPQSQHIIILTYIVASCIGMNAIFRAEIIRLRMRSTALLACLSLFFVLGPSMALYSSLRKDRSITLIHDVVISERTLDGVWRFVVWSAPSYLGLETVKLIIAFRRRQQQRRRLDDATLEELLDVPFLAESKAKAIAALPKRDVAALLKLKGVGAVTLKHLQERYDID